jgi:hypothetical protein
MQRGARETQAGCAVKPLHEPPAPGWAWSRPAKLVSVAFLFHGSTFASPESDRMRDAADSARGYDRPP